MKIKKCAKSQLRRTVGQFRSSAHFQLRCGNIPSLERVPFRVYRSFCDACCFFQLCLSYLSLSVNSCLSRGGRSTRCSRFAVAPFAPLSRRPPPLVRCDESNRAFAPLRPLMRSLRSALCITKKGGKKIIFWTLRDLDRFWKLRYFLFAENSKANKKVRNFSDCKFTAISRTCQD